MVALTLTMQAKEAIRGALGDVELTARRQHPPGSSARVRGVGATGCACMQAGRQALGQLGAVGEVFGGQGVNSPRGAMRLG